MQETKQRFLEKIVSIKQQNSMKQKNFENKELIAKIKFSKRVKNKIN